VDFYVQKPLSTQGQFYNHSDRPFLKTDTPLSFGCKLGLPRLFYYSEIFLALIASKLPKIQL